MPSAAVISAQLSKSVSFPSEAGAGSQLRLAAIIEHLSEIVGEETAHLRGGAAIDLKVANDRKSQALLELSRALRQVDPAAARDRAVAGSLAELRLKLEDNQAVLKLHLEAVREVSNIVCAAIRHAESDGTYSASIRKPGYEPWCD
jgi:hypothetical protein